MRASPHQSARNPRGCAAAAAVGVRVQFGTACEQASGLLLRLPAPYGACVATAAHVLRCRDEGAAGAAAASCVHRADHVWRERAAAMCGCTANGRLRFRARPDMYWRHDNALDLIVVAARCEEAAEDNERSAKDYEAPSFQLLSPPPPDYWRCGPACQAELEASALPLSQLASARWLCGLEVGAPVFVWHGGMAVGGSERHHAQPPPPIAGTIAIHEGANDPVPALRTVDGAPLLLEYTAQLADGMSGAGIYDSAWRLVAVHVRGDSARGRGVTSDALRSLVEQRPSSRLAGRLQPRRMAPAGHTRAQRAPAAAQRGDGCAAGCRPHPPWAAPVCDLRRATTASSVDEEGCVTPTSTSGLAAAHRATQCPRPRPHPRRPRASSTARRNAVPPMRLLRKRDAGHYSCTQNYRRDGSTRGLEPGHTTIQRRPAQLTKPPRPTDKRHLAQLMVTSSPR
jgi:hypothetical protein